MKKLSNIQMIGANSNHCLVLEREDTEAIEYWPWQKVAEWLTQIGFGDSANIIKYKQIKGEDIVKSDENFWSDVLGLIQETEILKFRYELNTVKTKQQGKDILYGWGINHFGQLGLFGSSFSQPKEIPMPEFDNPKDRIVQIECGRRNCAILSRDGEVWIAGNFKGDKSSAKTG